MILKYIIKLKHIKHINIISKIEMVKTTTNSKQTNQTNQTNQTKPKNPTVTENQKLSFERKLNSDGSVNPKYVDLLEEDKPIAGQKFVCISFVSPEKI